MRPRLKIEHWIMIAIILVSLAQGFWLFKGMQFDHTDSGLQGYINFSQFFYGFFMWGPTNYTGLITSIGSSIGFLLSLFDGLLFVVFGWVLSSEVFYGLLIAVGNISVFFLLYLLLEGKPLIGKILAGSFAMALFSFYTAINNGPGYGIVGAFLPASMLFALMLAKSLERKSHNSISLYNGYILFALFAASLSFLFAFGGAAYIIQNVLTIAFPMLFLVLFVAKSNKRKLFAYYLFGVLLAAAIVSPSYWSTQVFTKAVGNVFFNSGSFWIIHNLNYQNIFTSLQLYAQSGWYRVYYAYEVALVIFGLSSLAYLKRNGMDTRAFILGAFISFFVIVFIWDNFGLPFGQVFNVLINHFNELLVFRYSGSSLYYCIGFLYAVLAGFGIGSIYDTIRNMRHIKAIKYMSLLAFALLVVLLIGIRVYYNDYANYYTYNGISIPNHVYKISVYINSQKGNFNVGLLPVESPFMQFDSWYEGTDVYTYLINNPSFTGAYVAAQELFFPPSTNEYYRIGNGADRGYLLGTPLSNALGILGIKYVVVQGDAIQAGDMGIFSFNSIYTDINNTPDMHFEVKYGNSSVYENRNYVHLAYASNLINLGNASSGSIFDAIAHPSFNIQNTSVYSTHIDNFYNDSNTINATSIANFTKPDITFIENNPTQVTVHISNATTPFYLVFRETYDPHWTAFYSNGTEVNPRDHIAVNGFANAWYMNRTGNYTVILYYTLQTDAWIAWGVSFAALFVTIGIGVYGWKESTKAKMRRHG